MTHAAAFSQHSGFTLQAGVDQSADARNRFEAKFGVPAFSNVDSIQHLKPHVMAVSTPTQSHNSVVEKCLSIDPILILLEKPLASNLSDAINILKLSADRNCQIAVNYIRRFEPGTTELKQRINAGVYGQIRKGIVWYAKGLLNNGSHFIDLCRFLLGEITELQLLKPGMPFGANDAEPDFLIRFGQCDVYFMAGRENDFSVKELILLTEIGIIRYEQGGERIRIQKAESSHLFDGYKVLADNFDSIQTDFMRYQWHVADHLYGCLTGQQTLVSDGVSALETQKNVEKLLQLRKVTRED